MHKNVSLVFLAALSACAASRSATVPAGPCDTAVERYDTDKRRAQQAIGVRDCFARVRDEAGLEKFLTGRRVSQDARHRAAFKMFMAAKDGGAAARAAVEAYTHERDATVVDLRSEHLAPLREEPWFKLAALDVLSNDLERSNIKGDPSEILSELRAAKLPTVEGITALANPVSAGGAFVAIEGEVRQVRPQNGQMVAVLDSIRIIKQLIDVRTSVVGRTVYTTRTYEEMMVPQGRTFTVVLTRPNEALLKEAHWVVAGLVVTARSEAPRQPTPVFYDTMSDDRRDGMPELVIEGGAVARRARKWTE